MSEALRLSPVRTGFVDRILCVVFPRRDIVIDGELYLRRWFLSPLGLPCRVFLHNIRRSDPGRALHDHPWDFATFLLGSYSEALPGGRLARRPRFSFLRNPAEHAHRVVLDEDESGPRPVFTIMFARQARRVWGFHAEGGWRDWRTHLGEEGVPDSPEDVVSDPPRKEMSR